MSDLKDILPTKSATVEAIETWWKQRGDSEPERNYLGGSEIGKECSRALWYSFRKCSKPEFSGRLYRLFYRGHNEEFTFVKELRGIGCEVHEVGEDGKQFEVVACDGHFKGHTDGVALGIPEAPKTWHLLEMKTSSAKLFKKVSENGVEVEKPQHFAQMQVYMHLIGLKRALYMVVNKDNDELYTERVRYDAKKAQALIDKARRIISASTPPERISDRPDAWACKFCDAKALCHGTSDVAVDVPKLDCRQCVHATPIEGGNWKCELGKDFGTVCDQHLFLPGLINFAEPTDSLTNKDGSAVMELTSDDGTVWHHGPCGNSGQFSSQALTTTTKDLILPSIKKPKTEEKEAGPNLEARYSTENDGVKVAWKGRAADLWHQFGQMFECPMTNPNAEQSGNGWEAAEFYPHGCVIVSGNTAEIRTIEQEY